MGDLTVRQRIRKALCVGRIEVHPHAAKRLREKGMIDADVIAALGNGWHEPSKDSIVQGNWRYRINGRSVDGKFLSLAIELEDSPDLLIVTVIN